MWLLDDIFVRQEQGQPGAARGSPKHLNPAIAGQLWQISPVWQRVAAAQKGAPIRQAVNTPHPAHRLKCPQNYPSIETRFQ